MGLFGEGRDGERKPISNIGFLKMVYVALFREGERIEEKFHFINRFL